MSVGGCGGGLVQPEDDLPASGAEQLPGADDELAVVQAAADRAGVPPAAVDAEEVVLEGMSGLGQDGPGLDLVERTIPDLEDVMEADLI